MERWHSMIKSTRIPARNVMLKRVYEPASAGDGARVLVDRLWPRGVSKDRAALTGWCKEVAPSTNLRKWFGHEPARWNEFRERYKSELKGNVAPVAALRQLARQGRMTLVFGARDEIHNEAVVLREFLLGR
jgi:uncharacterized protein YeaO (DUF488 family)